MAHSSNSLTQQARLLIDPGSELTFVSEQLTCLLNLNRNHSSLPILGIGGTKATQTRGIVSLTLSSLTTDTTITVQAHILTKVSSILPSVQLPDQTWPHIERIKLADPQFLTPSGIDIIIGADTYGQIIKPNIIRGSGSMPVAQLSIFGWLVLGPVQSTQSSSYNSYHVQTHQEISQLQDLLTKFWTQEELPSDSATSLTAEELECEEHFKSTHSRDSDGRYIV